MASFEAVYLKIDGGPNSEFFQNIKAFLRNNGLFFGEQIIFRYHQNYPWIQIQELPWIEHLFDKSDTSFAPKFASLLSKSCKTEVICIYCQTVVDAIGFWHFNNGDELRCLVHGFYNERIWEEVRGTNEEWENKVFFDLQRYKQVLLDEDDLAEEVIKICQTKHIHIGSGIPFFSSGDIRKIAEHFHLPGFSNRLDWSIERKM